ncbi:MAG: nuclear transport factor 2 family protein [Tildeniella nuda ZEHNDER 1965/U140]|jgi:ketosteroid isomerase-like protein|nr:nuclear transport factor 2 family protein [Tildeniella nuda ZEHNDER 1965/U140]
MNQVDRVSLLLVRRLLASMLVGLATLGVGSTVATAHPVSDSIKQASTPTASKSQLRESEIRAIFNATKLAAEQKDVEGIMKYMAPNITIKMTLKLDNGSQSLNLTRAQYQQYLQQGFEATQRYSSKYTNLKVKIAPDGKTGTASYTLLEEATLKGQPVTLVSTSQETIKFERIKGEILATAVTSDSTIVVK